MDEFLSSNEMKKIYKKVDTVSNKKEQFNLIYRSISKRIDSKLKFGAKPKNDTIANELKGKGNLFFRRDEYQNALDFYNQAIIYASFKTSNNSSLYAICLSNRSASLYHLQDYSRCLEDIKEALKYPISNQIKFKLYERKAQVFHKLKDYDHSFEAINLATELIDNIHSKLLKQKLIANMNKLKSNNQNRIKDLQNKTLSKNENDPVFDIEENIVIASEKIKFKYTKELGMHVIASENINIGDVIVKEKAFASYIMKEYLEDFCQNCNMKVKVVFPCENCSYVVFCSFECRDKCNFHHYECNIIDFVLSSDQINEIFIPLRMLTKVSPKFLMEIKEDLSILLPEKKIELIESFILHKDENIRNGQNFPNCNIHSRNLDLEKHEKKKLTLMYNLQRKQDKNDGILAVIIIKLLKNTGYFEDIADIDYFGRLLIDYIAIARGNRWTLRNVLPFRNEDILETCSVNLGLSLYIIGSLFNHSCCTSVIRQSLGNNVTKVAISPIKAGESIEVDYGFYYDQFSLRERQTSLKYIYKFNCKCRACTEDWTSIEKMIFQPIKIKCFNCSSFIGNLNFFQKSFLYCKKCKRNFCNEYFINIITKIENKMNFLFRNLSTSPDNIDVITFEKQIKESLKLIDEIWSNCFSPNFQLEYCIKNASRVFQEYINLIYFKYNHIPPILMTSFQNEKD